MKILNLYCGIGGNRKLWGNEHEITAVEYDSKIADKYKALYPNDTVIVADAHEYLLENYENFDFVWSSPPCQSHSRTNYFLNAKGVVRYPDMKLYQEIIFLQNFYKGLFCVENVIGYYEPLIKPIEIGRHYLWSNFNIPLIAQPKDDIGKMCGKNQTAGKKHITERNAVNSELGLHILNCSLGIYTNRIVKQSELF
jgi:DNA (cytosine-5)-methyltransferase 1